MRFVTNSNMTSGKGYVKESMYKFEIILPDLIYVNMDSVVKTIVEIII